MNKENYSTDFEEFVVVNNIKKKTLAEYLNVSAAFITQLVQGIREVPQDKLALIKAVPYWNTDMLDRRQKGRGDRAVVDSVEEDVTLSREVFEQIKQLTETIAAQQRTISLLTEQLSVRRDIE